MLDKKEEMIIRKEIEELLTDFGFVEPNNIVNQIKSIFNVEEKDINVRNVFVSTKYEVHYKNYIVSLSVSKYQFVINEILPYDINI